jgi:hypothetical protein
MKTISSNINEMQWPGQSLNVNQDVKLKLCRYLYKFAITRYVWLSTI